MFYISELVESFLQHSILLLSILSFPSFSYLVNSFLSYANSVLQALYFCGPFRDLVVQYPDPSALDIPPPSVTHPLVPQQSRPKQSRKFSTSDSTPYSSNSPPQPNPPPPIPPAPPTLISALRSLYVHISNNPADKGTVAPRAFIDKIKDLNELFRTSQHQDAHEFLNFLLNKIVEDIEDDRRNGRPTSSLNNVNLPLDCKSAPILLASEII